MSTIIERAMTRSDAEDLLYREARLLDERRFDDWLAMYHDDVVFWMPAWRDETTLTTDPDSELSLIYYEGKQNLADRVWRLGSGLSNASVIPARVSHLVGNVIVDSCTGEEAVVLAAFTAHHHDPRSDRTHVFFGHYRHVFRRSGDEWLIAAKTINLMNDCIPTVADLYML
ncbi:aromatic-ring-hydroxylating dioxygenase subunit beta [Sphingobium lignivorans]|uniref:3-phenylpropionate/cinnamic acid dioxygenase small subunit n=1 Tax=Sphingobium lignivorans TaxID=2735886 RepID=A0ABR6NGG9_9SPHN|nr:aromatic-ring-hydroxylating dioxygenase subunit beta [Sphingobium lignivorans]MBB5985732.1 3-phenylpropionate/cinnamic acid dioxygenase small subunit [Sphingobium lignivorans]